MACRVGMTTDVEARKKSWKSEYKSLRNWQVLKSGLSREAAQKEETRIAKKYGCTSSPGGAKSATPFDLYSIYHFYHSGY